MTKISAYNPKPRFVGSADVDTRPKLTSDDRCEACEREVATHEVKEGILCDTCYGEIYGGSK